MPQVSQPSAVSCGSQPHRFTSSRGRACHSTTYHRFRSAALSPAPALAGRSRELQPGAPVASTAGARSARWTSVTAIVGTRFGIVCEWLSLRASVRRWALLVLPQLECGALTVSYGWDQRCSLLVAVTPRLAACGTALGCVSGGVPATQPGPPLTWAPPHLSQRVAVKFW